MLGGIWISQLIPAVIVGLYTRWLNPWALIVGWAAGIVLGHLDGCDDKFPVGGLPTGQLGGLTVPAYAALYALAVNFVLGLVLTPIFNRLHAGTGSDDGAGR